MLKHLYSRVASAFTTCARCLGVSDSTTDLRIRAKQGDATAQFELGNIYSEGLLLPQNNKAALEWYFLAAKQGHAQAHRAIGSCYMGCLGVPQDPAEGANWYRKAAELGDIKACTILGTCYECAIGVPQDKIMAMYWYRKAAESGDASAQGSLGGCYFLTDLSEAYVWLSISVANGYEDAVEMLERVTKKLSQQELEVAKGRSEKLQTEIRLNIK